MVNLAFGHNVDALRAYSSAQLLRGNTKSGVRRSDDGGASCSLLESKHLKLDPTGGTRGSRDGRRQLVWERQ